MSTTVVYYSSCTEEPVFERQIRAKLIEAKGALPLISVTQTPAPGFGQNICVGPVGSCDANALRQLLIGAEAAKTRWCVVAEADALYPPEYFSFVPPQVEACYRYANVWILSLWKPRDGRPRVFKQKYYSECAQVIGREFLLRHLEATLAGRPVWSTPDMIRPGLVFRLKPPEWQLFTGATGVVNVKTGRGLRIKTGTIKNELPPESLPGWGSADLLSQWLGA